VFPAMSNYTKTHKMTSVGNDLIRMYRTYLLAYERAHPQDIPAEECFLCGGGGEAGEDWLSCNFCERWQHYNCDARGDLASFREFSKANGPPFACMQCSKSNPGAAKQALAEGKKGTKRQRPAEGSRGGVSKGKRRKASSEEDEEEEMEEDMQAVEEEKEQEEESNEDDEVCYVCESLDGGDEWLGCEVCERWQHYNCDTRTDLRPFLEYEKEDGEPFWCADCASGKTVHICVAKPQQRSSKPARGVEQRARGLEEKGKYKAAKSEGKRLPRKQGAQCTMRQQCAEHDENSLRMNGGNATGMRQAEKEEEELEAERGKKRRRGCGEGKKRWMAHTEEQDLTVEVQSHGCSRSPLNECTEKEFLKDLRRFLEDRDEQDLARALTGAKGVKQVTVNQSGLDAFGLYKQVVERGGMAKGLALAAEAGLAPGRCLGINWAGQVFPAMRNYTKMHRMTAVGNELIRIYRTFLLAYERAHPQDLALDECCLCNGGPEAGDDWLSCNVCERWQHYNCDARGNLASFREFSKANGPPFTCMQCSKAPGSRAGAKRQRITEEVPAGGKGRGKIHQNSSEEELEEEEVVEEEEVAGEVAAEDDEVCYICNSLDGGDEWVGCEVCERWQHYDCDIRTDLLPFLEYAKDDGEPFRCGACSS
ncbi:hypothetical protein CYMTET_36357, partial [Cymbomonas tetramitiformis]